MGGGARRSNILNPARYFEAISILALHGTQSLDYYNKHNFYLSTCEKICICKISGACRINLKSVSRYFVILGLICWSN